MALCSRCRDIELNVGIPYFHSTSSHIETSAERGCLGCIFFLGIIEQTENEEDHGELDLYIHRLDELRLGEVELRDETGVEYEKTLLQICSSYDFEPTPLAEYDRGNEEVGRIIAPHSADPRCLNLAKEWFYRCTTTHGSLCVLEEDFQLPTRLIHIPSDKCEHLRLVLTENLKGLQYVALSYCWGEGTAFKTTPSTIGDRLSGFPVESLPQLLQDAVGLAREFGMEWIWIDSICIVQGDEEDWSRESSMMADVYGNATFTICADHAWDMDEGLLHARDLPVSHSFGPDNSQIFCLQHASGEWDHMCDQALYYRGWAFQERILAPRILHFLDDQIAWECNTTLYREGFRGREPKPRGHFSKAHFASHFHQRRLATKPPTAGVDITLDLHDRLWKWRDIAQEISVRDFTVNSDTLPAISGLASAIQMPEMGQYFAGVWECNPFLCMAWHVRYSQPSSPVEYKAPSWSWVRTEHQLMWHAYICGRNITADLFADWKAWDTKWGPRLVHQHMILKNKDPKGEVLEGSYLVMTGFCRDVYMAPCPEMQYDEWLWVEIEEVQAEKGLYAYMDRWEDDVAFVSSFVPSLWKFHPEIEPSSERRYLCVQIAQEQRHKANVTKTFALVIEEVEGGDTFRRAGLLVFDLEDTDDSDWCKRELKLI